MRNSKSRKTESLRPRRTRIRRAVTILQVMILLGLSASVGILLGLFVSLSRQLPTIGDFEAPEATIIYSSDGVILGRIYREDRTNVPLKDIPWNLRKATIAVEDSRFYHHSGVDFKGIARALWINIQNKRMEQGGSTITQQLAKNVYLSPRRTLERKLQEAALAILMERNFTKDKILELYLNQVFYGSGAFGVQAASRIYFGKDVDQLDLSEAAMIAGLPKAPSVYSPHEDEELAIKRRNVVLRKMAEQGYITQSQYEEAKAERVKIQPRSRGRNEFKAPHFVDYVAKQLRYQFGDDVVYSGGLRVYTTLNWEMQQIAEKALRQGVKKYERTRRVTEGCFVAVEPTSGYIRAMVGSVNPYSEYNRCTQGNGQQPGSSFKAFVYTAAMASGMKPTDRVLDARKSYSQTDGTSWNPRNYNGEYKGYVTIKQAVAQSMNMPAIRTAEKIGMHKIISYARLMGVESPIQPYLSSAIGASEVKPLEMASAYGTFANGGVYVKDMSIVRITDSHGEIIEEYVPEARRVISQKVNAEVDELLRGVVIMPYGTGKGVRDVSEARGKTGTTNDDRDAWFIGYVPGKLAAACWVGNDDNTPMRSAYGGTVCGPIWKEFMLKSVPIFNKVYSGQDKKQARHKANEASKPKNDSKPNETREQTPDPNADVTQDENSDVVAVKICNSSQLVATSNCPSWHTERFVRGLEPKDSCTEHPSRDDSQVDNAAGDNRDTRKVPNPNVQLITVTVCADSGKLASRNCPNRVTKRIPLDEVPSQTCNLHSRSGNRE